MNIYLIRHGEKQEGLLNLDKLELTERGIMQANHLGTRLKRYNIEKIYSSDMVRAIQTSKEINKYLNVDIVIEHELREIDMGEYIKKDWGYIEKTYPDFAKEFIKHTSDVAYPDGECGKEVWMRAKKVIKKIINSGLENVAVIAHGGMIRVLISGFLEIQQERRFYFGSPLEFCSITLIKYDKKTKKFYIHYFNDYSHLEDMTE